MTPSHCAAAEYIEADYIAVAFIIRPAGRADENETDRRYVQVDWPRTAYLSLFSKVNLRVTSQARRAGQARN